MTSRATKAFATGIKYIGGGDTSAYTLEFLTPTSKYPQGSFETIVVPYLEIGRDNCLISFGSEVPTVSRKHAAIERNNKEIILKNLSKTNPTLVNGRPVIDKYYLNSGDEIQFSLEGPKVRFNEYKAGAPKLAFTKRMNLVMNQAVKPYKRALITLGIIVGLITLVGAYFIYQVKKDNKNLLLRVETSDKQSADSLATLNALSQELKEKLESKKGELQESLKKQKLVTKPNSTSVKTVNNNAAKLTSVSGNPSKPTPVLENIIAPAQPFLLSIFLTSIRAEWNGSVLYEEQLREAVCDGFLLSNGHLITSRYCTDIHSMVASELNFIANSGGKVTYTFEAVSSDKETVLRFTNHDLKFDDKADVYEKYTYAGIDGNIKLYNAGGSDIAYFKTGLKKGIPYNSKSSKNITAGTELLSINNFAYSSPSNTNSKNIDAVKIKVASIKVHDAENIQIEHDDTTLDIGSPLFVIKDNKAIAVAMVSGFHKSKVSNQSTISLLMHLNN
ncbi:pSer/pThr/pTyr-binding forkhead associated (FHA) protein [Pontibacter aydingkolensis]|uniref:FHA domain-containing protein n=1 Tax=Pontibacter aydingkolensis TaxID=1911536 RepID=A0ABS7CSQ5_9BACT|nr:FHA domain-containing protein [Pontibacter aydingkolensis]MBW7466870.1 FHA domain-containing protein [Pontibacter aydingkolensis]